MDIKTIDLDRQPITTPSRTVTPPNPKSSMPTYVPVIVITLVLGVLGYVSGGYVKSLTASSAPISSNSADIPTTGIKVGDVYGSADEKTFSGSATGVLDKGGINGEGTHKLLRPGGASQTAYLTSSVIDLDLLVGHQVTIWGETFKGQKAGWLMDVGRAKVEQLDAPLPE